MNVQLTFIVGLLVISKLIWHWNVPSDSPSDGIGIGGVGSELTVMISVWLASSSISDKWTGS
jgi:hypothetical protein